MKKYLIVAFILIIVLSACGTSAPATEVVAPTSAPTAAEAPTATEAPLPTETPAPTETAVPVTATAVELPQKWSGVYHDEYGRAVLINVLIAKMEGLSFTGSMYWAPLGNFKGALSAMNGEFITDIDTATEQNRWRLHKDFKNEDKSGTWLRFTETDILDGCCLTMGGWYYAHIRSDGTLVGIYFYNSTDSQPANATFELKLK